MTYLHPIEVACTDVLPGKFMLLVPVCTAPLSPGKVRPVRVRIEVDPVGLSMSSLARKSFT